MNEKTAIIDMALAALIQKIALELFILLTFNKFVDNL